MVSANVSQLLLSGLGTVREFSFAEPLANEAAGDLHLRGPIRGHARLTRTGEGILVHAEYTVPVTLECGRCLDETPARISGALDEEFLPSTDVRTGAPVPPPNDDDDDERLFINEHHEIELDEVLRQNILTNLPLRPLCSADCPGLCQTCGQRLDPAHQAHLTTEDSEPETPMDPANPFARLAVLLKDDPER